MREHSLDHTSSLKGEPALGSPCHAAIIAALVVIAYLNSIRGGFQFSDFNVIVNNPAVHSWSGWWETIRQHGIRPLLKLSYTFSWVSGSGVTGFHLFNITVHLISSLLVYFLSARCIASWVTWMPGTRIKPTALFVALLFALHPVHTEAVTYISGRSSSLMALFFLGSLLAYVRGTDGGGWSWSKLVSPLLFVAAVATKEVAVILPLALLLWDRAVVGRPFSRSIKEQWPHWFVLLILMAVICTHPRYLSLLLFSSELRGITDNLISQIDGFSYLLTRLLFLNRLSIDPGVAAVASMNLLLWAKAALFITVVTASLIFRRSRPWLWFGVFWFIIALIPSNSIIARLDVVNERHLYLANFGIFLFIGCEASRLFKEGNIQRPFITVSSAILLGILLTFTVMRNNDYRNEVALWESTVKISPYNARGYNNLGCAYELAGKYDKALKAYERSLRINPLHENARLNLERLAAAGIVP
jgi:hypothetical protein